MYAVAVDGSLLIENIVLAHERTFAVLIFNSEFEEPITYHVDVITTVKPSGCPVINLCGEDKQVCTQEIKRESEVICSIHSRPKIDPYWTKRSEAGDQYMTTQAKSVIKDNVTFISSSLMMDDHFDAASLSLLVCKANDSSHFVYCNESSILILYGSVDYTTATTNMIAVEENAVVTITCTEEQKSFLIWRRLYDNRFENLGYAIFINKYFENATTDYFELDENGALTTQHVKTQHEGLYACIYSDGITDHIALYHLFVYINPIPAYPVINGCRADQYCVLKVNQEGILTCSLHGIRPKVTLSWRTLYAKHSTAISFSKKEVEVVSKGNTFDVVLTSTFKIITNDVSRLTLVCDTDGSTSEIPQWSTEFDLLILGNPVISTTSSLRHSQQSSTIETVGKPGKLLPIILVPTAVVIIILIIAAVIFRVYFRKSRTSIEDPERTELNTMLPGSTDGVSEKMAMFIQQMKTTYENQYSTIRPVPFIRDGIFGIGDIFVEGCMELQTLTGVRGQPNWNVLGSYQCLVVKEYPITSFLRVVEGDPGQGKSTLALQLVYEWCTGNSKSPLKHVDMLIFLRLRRLKGVTSIFQAIKHILLPTDTVLDDNDVKYILQKSPSVVFIFDGYDEFPHRNEETDICNIIKRSMFQNALVILTTRSNVLPKELAPNTSFARLSGFDENARNEYIRKAVKDDPNVAERIKQRMEESPILGEFMVVPLFFSMYAHIIYKWDNQVTFHSVTAFFRYIVSCFYGHEDNKDNDNAEKIRAFGESHARLDELAFNGLSAEEEKITWNKQEMLAVVGEEVYSNFIRIGILVAEDVTNIIDKPGISDSEHIQETTEVRFHHKLFCEWYAATFLSNYIMQISDFELAQVMSRLDPFNLQYVYRFACGLNPEVAPRIIKYLQSLKDGDKFAILCLLETTDEIEKIKENVQELCVETVLLSKDSSKLLQRSTLQLIDIACKLEIQTKCLHLEDCVHHADTTGGIIHLTSGLQISKLAYIKCLKITEIGREFSTEETRNMLKYILCCRDLQKVELECCWLPEDGFDDTYSLTQLQHKNIRVLWIPISFWYRLDSTGKWKEKRGGDMVTDDQYQAEFVRFRDEWRETQWQRSRIGTQ
ncbi:uncharacterized protein [Apostichopus japonicus]|uniref:uncharacterized protein n=1 Tax=Stichopus japonicus TaxID=307972 RepID=UPI003AB20E91